MPQITRALLRKRAEHNEGVISTLEEISLHQEELEGINEVLGMTCRKLKIIYLQNNIIPKMEHLHHMKDLEYLNLALNNIAKIEGLQNCEFLKKLDLTVNFVDLDTLEESMDHLASRINLQDLYMMGNPSQANWDQFNHYVIAKLPQLKTLDGTEITKSMQIRARQLLPKLEADLKVLAEQVRFKKAQKELEKIKLDNAVSKAVNRDGVEVEDVEEENELTENTPEARVKIYQELAQQKKEKEDREKINAPKERNYEKEQQESVQTVREKEAEMEDKEIKQKNEGGWDFFWDEESKPGHIILDVRVAKHLDSSLIDVDVNPTYVSVVIKSKTLRLRTPAEVKVGDSKCQRSKTTGSLMVIMPKVNPKENAVTIRGDIKAKEKAAAAKAKNSTDRVKYTATASSKLSLQEQMLQDAMQAAASSSSASSTLLDAQIGQKSANSVNVTNIVRKAPTSQEPATVFDMETKYVDHASKIMELS